MTFAVEKCKARLISTFDAVLQWNEKPAVEKNIGIGQCFFQIMTLTYYFNDNNSNNSNNNDNNNK